MKSDPNGNWPRIRTWARPMNQLSAGLFLNITGYDASEIEKAIDWSKEKSEDLRLEMRWIDQGYIRITFNVAGECLLVYLYLFRLPFIFYFRSDAI